MYRISYFIVLIFLKIFHRIKISGKENVPKKTAFIIVSNHSSYYDPPVLSAVVYPRRVRYMAKTELFKNPIMGLIFRWCGAFPVNREKIDRKSLKKAVNFLKENQIVGLFPEGTRIKDKEGRQVFQGAAYLALKSGAPVLPVGIAGTGRIMEGRSFIPRLAKVKLKVGEPIKFGGTKTDLAAFSVRIIDEIDKLAKSGN